jgi:hypothetical protein
MTTKSPPPKWSRTPRRASTPAKPVVRKTWCVYGIIDPRTDGLFYIGQTRSFARRKAEHLEGTDQISGLVIGQILAAGFLPHFVVLERHGNEETALRAEIFGIEMLLGRGVELVNSQAFDGYLDRTAKRAAETRKLADMQRLRALAHGRTARRTRPRPGKGATTLKVPAKAVPAKPDKPSPRRQRRVPSGVQTAGRP